MNSESTLSIVQHQPIPRADWLVRLSVADGAHEYTVFIDVNRDNAGEFQITFNEVKSLSIWSDLLNDSFHVSSPKLKKRLIKYVSAQLEHQDSDFCDMITNECVKHGPGEVRMTIGTVAP